MDNLKKLFKLKFIWKKITPGGIEFFAVINGNKYKLRMNDFPGVSS
jgi:hypothetical protein